MKTVLINPGKEHEGNLDARAAAPPLGLLYIASNLVKNGYDVKVIDQLGSSINDDELINQVKHYDPDLIGFSTMGIQTISAGRVTDKLKTVLPNSRVVFGGIAPTFSAEPIMKKYSNVDYCIKGEGEYSTIELIKALKNKAFSKVHGLVYRAGKRLKEGLPRKLIEDLDSLPFPDRDLVKNVKYGAISGLKVDGFTSILSSRGCPHACKYCCCNALVKRRWRARSINSVLDELELIQSEGYNNVLFFDDGLTINNNRLLKMCDGIKQRGLKLNWFFEGRVDNVKEDVLKQMARAGAKVCYFGAESANQHVLDYYKKGITPQQTI
ncbi:MAG: radical SAM protein, partial [Candidatus Nanoarchaeia archaeon]